MIAALAVVAIVGTVVLLTWKTVTIIRAYLANRQL